ILFLERNFAAGQAKEYRTKKVESILDRSLLPHLGDTVADRKKKAIFLGRVARSVLELSLEKRKEDDKDHYANKRLKLSGDLMEDLFRTSFSSLMKDLKYQLERSWGRKKNEKFDINTIRSSIRTELLTHKLIHALATGNWVGGRAGVSQLLDRTSNLSAMSHLRRVTSSLTRSQPHFEARDLHPTQWGRLCPSETPEGQNCGLVKNAALIIEISEGIPEMDIRWMLRELGIKTVKTSDETRVYVNGDLVGVHEDAKKLVNEIRERRRCGLISGEINVRFDQETDEVIINCDEGRLRRPLLIVKNGRLALTRKHIEGIREEKIKWNDLFREGIIEWIDAEEEEEALVLVSPYDVPARCPCCNHALSPTDADWMNPGKDEDAVLKCKWCGDEFTVPSKLDPKYTHMEVDPMIIIGVGCGIVPYPEHNSAPRITMGAAMGKQALGISCSNYRMRPDTRGHLMHYPQRPMVQTQTMNFMHYEHRPAGQNFCIAVLSYHGYNIEDALVMNKSSVQRGLGRSTFLRSYSAEEHRYPGGAEDAFEIPQPDVTGAREEDKYSMLGDDGLILPGSKVGSSDVLVGKTSPPRFNEEDTDFLTPQKRRETSVTVRHGESG
ncbi:MAG: DNA-directed RNA polymerase subunit B, partial [Candidatus Methanomethylophilaceae archaeon]|nr:DNA-directed RNA polymerase subunit B [Candidatus Methanomethylophilaceae archaeon]